MQKLNNISEEKIRCKCGCFMKNDGEFGIDGEFDDYYICNNKKCSTNKVRSLNDDPNYYSY